MYQEHQPEPSLAPFVECFWTSDIQTNHQRRVLPDGCVDLLFYRDRHQLTDARVVGVMTRPHLVDLSAGQSILGVRFNPGMAGICLASDISKLNDQSVPIQLVLGSLAEDLVSAFRRNRRTEAITADLTQSLFSLSTIKLVRHVVGELTGHRQVEANDIADAAKIGERQLRRTSIRHAGLPPKKLSRILRFRRAVQALRGGEINLARLAVDCGYFDQAHMNRDFREFAGQRPTFFIKQ